MLSLTVAACGGGSTGGGSTTASPTTQAPPAPAPNPGPTPIAYNTAEYQENPSLAQMNAQAAYLNGIIGDGVLVAVIDSGVTEIPELQGQLHPDSINIVTTNDADIDDFNGHGTAMAGIIAARRDGAFNNDPPEINMHGIAFNAQILNINTTSAANCDADDCNFFNSDIADAYDYARIHNVDVINESLGSDNPSSAALLAAAQRAVDADILIVVPAGNRADPSTPPTVTEQSVQQSAAFAYAPWANGQVIIAGSVDEDNTISDFSYYAGDDAQGVFLVAPGRGIVTPDYDTTNDYDYVSVTGTSASTAQISGAAALMFEAFPNLSAAQVADLFFTTATDLGAPGTDNIYGRGLINLEEAFSAQGQLTIAGSGFAAGVGVGTNDNVAQQNLFFSGGAFGADISFAAALDNIMVLDKYQRSYHIDFSQSIYNQQPYTSLDAFMNNGLTSKYQNVSLDENTTLRLGWRRDDRFSDIDKKFFSNHLGRDRKAGDLRMAVTYNLNKTQSAVASAGMSLTEMMEDYRPDDYMAPGKHGFSSLLTPDGTQAASFKNQFGKKTALQSAYANSKASFGEELFSRKINVESSLFLNRISHQVTNNLTMALDLGFLEEKGSVLGAVSRGAVEIGKGASTGFVGTKLDYFLSNDSQLFARASYGITKVDQSSRSILGNISSLKSYSYLIGIKSRTLLFENDELSFTFSQPLRLDGGSASVSRASGRNYETGQFTTSFERISLNPSGTERDFELSYSIANIYGARVQLNLLHQLNPGHIKSINSATSLLFRLGSAF